MEEKALIESIEKLKKKRKAVILAHNYQFPQIQKIADFLGDSLELSKRCRSLDAEIIVFCGVTFMAETAKILSPRKTVLLPVEDAGCPLADTITPEQLTFLKQKHPDAWVVSYVNSSAAIKALSDVCCTSANAVTVVKNVPAKKIIFVPDKNLGWWVQHNVKEKEIITWPGFCYVHEQFTLQDLSNARKNFPDAELIVHPECRKEILKEADFVASTSGMLKAAQQSKALRFVIGTEEGLIYRLSQENPEKKFYSLGPVRVCSNMKKTMLNEVHAALEKEIHQITVDEHTVKAALTALERMIEYV